MKISTAFQLGAITEPVKIALKPKDNVWYPIDSTYSDNTLFIRGKGQIKIGKWKKETLNPLATLTAENLKIVYDKYGINVTLGMVKGWGGTSLYHDYSYGLNSVRYEVVNMAKLGKLYDDFTDKVQAIGDNFIQSLLSNGFTLQGTIEKGSLWYNYKNENECGHLVGFVGVYERNPIHPLQHIEHYIGHSCLGACIMPQFNPITFDVILTKLFLAKYYKKDTNNMFEESRKMLDKIVSVKDRIAHLTSQKNADEIESIFELQKTLTIS